jgi:hypothetical protein
VLPSHAYETLGKTILESYAEARAVVASDMGSRRELIRGGETGLLYRSGDVEQLTEAIRSLGSNPELAEKMGRAGRESVRQRYTPEAHYQKLFSLYEGLVRRKATQGQGLVALARKPSWMTLASDSGANQDSQPFAAENRRLRVAFIGGRGVISKYSGIETY